MSKRKSMVLSLIINLIHRKRYDEDISKTNNLSVQKKKEEFNTNYYERNAFTKKRKEKPEKILF